MLRLDRVLKLWKESGALKSLHTGNGLAWTTVQNIRGIIHAPGPQGRHPA